MVALSSKPDDNGKRGLHAEARLGGRGVQIATTTEPQVDWFGRQGYDFVKVSLTPQEMDKLAAWWLNR